VRKPALESLGPAGVTCSDVEQRFCKDRPVAGPLVAEESPDAHSNGNGNSLPGQVGKRPGVPGVDPAGLLSAHRARSCSGSEVFADRVMAFGQLEADEI